MSTEPSTESSSTLFQVVSDAGQPVDKELVHVSSEDKLKEASEPASHEVTPKINLYDFLVYRGPLSAIEIIIGTGSNRVWSGRINIYNRPGDEALHAVVNRYLDSIEWVQLMSWRNDLSTPQVFEQQYTTSLTVTDGREVETGFNMGASFRGLSVGVSGSVRTFSTRETTSSETTRLEVTVPAHSLAVFYQRRFNFRDEITFINDAWGSHWNVGPWGGYTPLTRVTSRVQIMADEWFTSDKFLPFGPGLLTATTTSAAALGPATRRREDITSRARTAIANMGA